MFSWDRSLHWLFPRSAKKNKKRLMRRQSTAILTIEQLEARCTPSTINYSVVGSNYTQNFSTLPDAGENATITPGTGSPVYGPYDLTSSSGSNTVVGSGLTGWYAANISTGQTAELFAAGKPTTTTGALFDFNDGINLPALGTISTGTTSSRFGAILQNNTGETLTQFTLSYTGEEWWQNNGSGDTLGFSYEIESSSPSLPTGTSGYTGVSFLNYTVSASGSGSFVDGSMSGTSINSSNTPVTGINWSPGTYLVVFWDKGAAGASKSPGLGVANVSFSAAATPTVTSSTDSLPVNATSMTILGSAFDTTASHNSVSFNNGVTGTVTSVNASGTSMTVTSLSGLSSLSVGTVLKASVTVDSVSSGSAVQVATIAAASTPTVTSTTDNLPLNATSMTIDGTGFDTVILANDVVTFNNSVTGTVTSATATSLTVTGLSGLSSLSVGTVLNASVAVDGVSSGSAVQVATIAASSTPTVSSSTANLSDEATSMTIAGTGFDPNIVANDVVTFNNGVTGTVTSATTTSLTVGSLSGLNVLATGTALSASVAVDGVSSGSTVQVATVAAAPISYATAGSSYTQNFSTLSAAGGTASIVTNSAGVGPYDLTAPSPTGFGASGVSGWYTANIGSAAAGTNKLGQGEPSTTTGALFDFNDGTSGSQSLGTISTTAVASRFGAIFVNTTGKTLNQFTLSYTGEEWWDNSGKGTSLNFSYEVGVSGLPTDSSGTTVSQLGFTAPDSTGSGQYIDAFTTSADQVAVNYTVSGLTWSSGQTLAIYWDKGAGAGTSDGLGIADVNFSAAVVPIVNSSTDSLPTNATSMTILGSGFDPTAANDSVSFSNGVTGTVTSVNASGTSLTVTSLSGLSSLAVGTVLNASVTSDSVSSGSAVQVATIAAASTPTVTSTTDNLPLNATSMTIDGSGFDSIIPANDVVTFDNGVTGTVTSATATSLTVTSLSGLSSLSVGTVLNASVAVDGVSSGSAVQVATIAASSTPTVSSSSANLADEATSMTIGGTGFDPNIVANNVVTFNNGVTGTVTSASTTSLTVGNLSGLSVLAVGTALKASVAVDGVTSGSAVQVATIAAAPIGYSTAGSNYTQNFSTLPDAGGTATIATGTGSPVQGPYDLTSSTTGAFGASGLSGWYAANIASTPAAEKFAAGEPSTTTGALFDFNDGTAGSQSLGTISTSGTTSRFGALFVNNTGVTLNQFTLSYTGEEWWANSGSGTSLGFSYELGVSSLPTDSSGTTVSQLGFTAPTSGSSQYIDAFTTAADQVAVNYTVTGLSWTSGQTLAIYWDKGAGAGSSDGLGVAGVTFSAAAVPVVNSSTDGLPTNATSMTILGSFFDTNPANDSVSFSNGVTGTVSSVNASGTSMTVTSLSGLGGLAVGTALNATVTSDGVSSGSAVQVATVAVASTPTVTSSTDGLPVNATSMTILGSGFDSIIPANNVVSFSNGVTGTVTSATATSLTVTSLNGVSSLSVGTVLNASVAVDGVSSGSAVQVATIAASSTPTVTSSGADLADEATSMTIAGTGFDPNITANDVVTFNNGVMGTVTSASTTSLTVGNLSGLDLLPAGTVLNASVAVDGVSSGSAVQVATVVAATIGYGTPGGSYTQNFSTLPDAGGTASITTGTGSPVQGPYDLTSSLTGAFGASGLGGWYAANIASTPAAEKFAAGEPSTTTGALFDFNDGTSGSQALGTISTGGTASRFGALLVNNTGETLNQFTLSYLGEEWWDNSGSGTGLNFSYELGVASLPTGTSGYTTVSSLGFTAPDSSDSGTYVDGFTTTADQVSVSGSVTTGFNWTAGETLAIFWDKGAAPAPVTDWASPT